MKYAIIAAGLLMFAAPPAFAGGKGALVGNILAPVTTAVSALNVSVLNGSNVSVLSGNKTGVAAPVGVNAPISVKGLLGGAGLLGCGCN